ncbi:MAG: glycosyltransferase family 4 protein, partial [Armatimonadetes bacterium]|nr:glycosyltransferase family 4 protein [Armatimonadota bacterium]
REQTLAGHEPTILVGRQIPGAPETWHDALRGTIVQYDKGASPPAWLKNGREACTKLLQSAKDAGKPFDLLHTHFAYAAVGALQSANGSLPHVRSFYGPWDAEGFVEDMGQVQKSAAWKKPLLHGRALLKRHYRREVEADNLRQSHQVIILSEQSRGEVLEFGYTPANIHKIPGGVNRERFFVDTANPDARQEARGRAGLPAEAFPLLLSVRRLTTRMGLENLIAALPTVREAFPRTHLVIGGRGNLRESLEAQANALGVADAVTFAGFIADDKIVDYYRGADAFVLPTLALEGFGLVTVEALACGTPVIGTPTGATPEILRGIDERLLSAGTEPAHLADSITAFCAARLTPGSWASDLSAKKLCDFVDAHYTWKKHAMSVEKVYRQVLGT